MHENARDVMQCAAPCRTGGSVSAVRVTGPRGGPKARPAGSPRGRHLCSLHAYRSWSSIHPRGPGALARFGYPDRAPEGEWRSCAARCGNWPVSVFWRLAPPVLPHAGQRFHEDDVDGSPLIGDRPLPGHWETHTANAIPSRHCGTSGPGHGVERLHRTHRPGLPCEWPSPAASGSGAALSWIREGVPRDPYRLFRISP